MSFYSTSILYSAKYSTRTIRILFVLLAGLYSANQLACQVVFSGTQIEIAGSANFPLSAPSGIAVDGAGNLYIADSGDNQILLVSPNETGYSTPTVILGGLSDPKSVASDWDGNIFVADSGNNRVLMLPKGTQGITNAVTIASGFNNPSGLAVDWSENVYVTDSGNNQVIEIPWSNNSYGSAAIISTGFNNPTSIAVDSRKTLYIADTGNSRTVKELLTASGYGTKQFLSLMTPSPIGIAVDGSLNLWTGSASTGSIAKSPWNGGANRYNGSQYVAGGFALPQGIVINNKGVIFVADAANNRVMELLNTSANFGTVDVGSTPALQTYQFEITAGTTIGSTEIYTQGVSGQDFQDAGGSTCQPGMYSSNTLCVVNVNFGPLGPGARAGAIVLYDPVGNALATAFISGVGAEPQAAFIPGTISLIGTGLSGPAGVAVDGSGNVFIADTGNDRVVEVPMTATGYGPQVTIATEGISSPMGLAVDGADNLYIISNGNDKLLKLTWSGSAYGPAVKMGSGLYGPTSVAVDPLGDVYVADTLNSALWRIPWTGSGYGSETRFGSYTKFPYGIAVDGSGDVFFSSPYHNVVVEMPLIGGVSKLEVNLPLSGTVFPTAVAVDGNSDLYIADSSTNQVSMLPWNGIAFGAPVMIAGGFNAPGGIATDTSGNIYVADTGNNQIVKINLSAAAPVIFPATYLGSTSVSNSVIVQNVGNQTLSLSSINYPADFPQSTVASNPCQPGILLGQGANCSFKPTFTPLSVNPQLDEFISVTDNNQNVPGSQQAISLTGAATGELAQTINFPALNSVTYGAPDILLSATATSGLPITYQVASGPALIVGGQMLRVIGAGTITVQAIQSGNSVYQAAARVSITLNVAPAILTVSANSLSATYGSIPATFGYAMTGFVRNESSWNISGTPSVVATVMSNSQIGSYPITASLGSLTAANYTFVFSPGVLNVNPATLTVAAVSVANIFGKPLPSLAWILTGFKNGDSASSVTGAPILITVANSGSPAGIYPIVPSPGSLFASNYIFKMSAGYLTVHQAALLFTVNAQSIVYGSAIPALTYIVEGFAADDSPQSAYTGTPKISTSALSGSPAGQYSINITLGTLQATNYHFIFVGSSLTIQKAKLTVTPANVQIVYGQKLPDLTYVLSGFVNGDKPTVISGSPILSACTKPCEGVGEYSIAATLGALQAANYFFKMGTGTLTISKALLTLSANPVLAAYGTVLPKFTYTFQGLVSGDTPQNLYGQPEITSIANSKSSVGSYPIIATLGNLRAPNYTINFHTATLTIVKALLTIAPKPTLMVYGSAFPPIAYQITGFQNGDTENSAMSGTPFITTAASAHAKVGTYPIQLKPGTVLAKNYSFNFEPGSITIAPATLVVSANSLTMTVGSASPTLTYAVTGFQNGDSFASATTGSPSLTTNASAKSAAGNYAIAASAGTMKASNYLLTFTNGILEVTQ